MGAKATWADALKPVAAPAEKRPRVTKDGKCLTCGRDVFWVGWRDAFILAEVQNQIVTRHHCGADPRNDFEDE